MSIKLAASLWDPPVGLPLLLMPESWFLLYQQIINHGMRQRVSPSPPAIPQPCGSSMLLACGRGGFELRGAVGAAGLTDKGWQPSLLHLKSPHPRCLLSSCAGHHHPTVSWQNWTSPCPSSSGGKVQHPFTRVGWGQVRCLGNCWVLYKSSWDEQPQQGPPGPLGGTDLWQRDGNRELVTCDTTPWTGSGMEIKAML